jgi:hypothetical protein
MSTDLKQRLAALADRAEAGAPPTDLWQRGVRRRRRRAAVTAAVAVVAVLAGGGAAVLLAEATTSSYAPEPTTSDAHGAIPDRVQAPSAFLPDVGSRPLGPVGVVAGAERRTGLVGEHNGIFGIGALDGRYRFLPLEHRFGYSGDAAGMVGGGDEVALSPDGRYVAYWLADDPGDRVDGVAVYDTVRDRFATRTIASRLGLDPQGLAWADDDTLLLGYGVITELTDNSMSSRGIGTRVWRLGEPFTRAPAGLDVTQVSTSADGIAAFGGTDLDTWTPGLQRVGRYRLTGLRQDSSVQTMAVSPGRGAVAAVFNPGTGHVAARLVTGALPAGASTRQRVPVTVLDTPLKPLEVLGWSDAGHVLVRGTFHATTGVFAVDAGTGEPQPLVAEPRATYSPGVAYASSLWSSPTASRPGPPTVIDPRVAALVGAGVVGLVVVLVGRWRRRRALG